MFLSLHKSAPLQIMLTNCVDELVTEVSEGHCKNLDEHFVRAYVALQVACNSYMFVECCMNFKLKVWTSVLVWPLMAAIIGQLQVRCHDTHTCITRSERPKPTHSTAMKPKNNNMLRVVKITCTWQEPFQTLLFRTVCVCSSYIAIGHIA